ncbi:hypothetical protein Tco_1249922, partial [Tanacetum coccineum]
EKELTDRLKDMERERDEWRQLIDGENRVQVLEKEKERLVGQLAQSEMARQDVIQE